MIVIAVSGAAAVQSFALKVCGILMEIIGQFSLTWKSVPPVGPVWSNVRAMRLKPNQSGSSAAINSLNS
jgi:hypothetical protein